MDVESLVPQTKQPTLFDLGASSSGTLELFPALWGAAEALTYPDPNVRRAGLERLIELGAARLSPLVVYLLSTRIADPDIALRKRIVQLLGEVLSRDELGNPAPQQVRSHLKGELSNMRNRQVYALLELVVSNPETEPYVASLLSASFYAGVQLVDILSNKKLGLDIRKQAVRFIGLVGYLDAQPFLERIISRLETRLQGQQAMPFAPPAGIEELDLLPDVQATLALLKAP